MALTKDWIQPTSRLCPKGHELWQCVERMAVGDLVVERRGHACPTCDWDDALPPYREGSHPDYEGVGRYRR